MPKCKTETREINTRKRKAKNDVGGNQKKNRKYMMDLNDVKVKAESVIEPKEVIHIDSYIFYYFHGRSLQ